MGHLPREQRPERGLLGIRKHLGLFANLRPAILYPELANASTLKPEVVAGLDILIVRELTGDITSASRAASRCARSMASSALRLQHDALHREEIRRIGRVAFEAAQAQQEGVLGRQDERAGNDAAVARRDDRAGAGVSGRRADHMLVDNAAMQLVKAPKQFDVMVTGNMFGDILSDEASMLTGSIGMLPSASLDANNKGLYEPSHGSAPDIAGKGVANPLATILRQR